MAVTKLGQMLKAVRQKQGLTTDELAKKARLTNGYISLLETGKRKNPSLAVLNRLAKSLRVPVAELLK